MNKNIEDNNYEDALIINSELKKFNWGAAVFGPLWGVFNGTFLRCISTFMVMILFIGIILLTIPYKIMSIIVFVLYFIYMGFKGSKWSWEEKKWKTFERFLIIQNRWNLSALIFVGIFFIIPGISFIIIYLMIGNIIFKSLSEIHLKNHKNTLAEIFLSDTNITSAANEYVIIDYLVKNKSDISEKQYIRVNKNTVKTKYSIFSNHTDNNSELYTFKKEVNCKLANKNCYIIKYKYENKKVIPISKMYFDSVGKYKTVKLIAKKSK